MAIWAATAIATATVGATRYFNRYRYFHRYNRYNIVYTERFKKLLQLQLEMADEERGLVASEMTGAAGSTPAHADPSNTLCRSRLAGLPKNISCST